MPDNTQSNESTETTNPTTPVVPDAVQKRFDEMTAERHELVRQMNAMGENMNAVLAQNAALALRVNAPVVTQPTIPEGIDPAVLQYLSQTMGASLKAELASVKGELQQMIGGVRANQQQTEMQQALVGADPVVAKEAIRLRAEWDKAGLTGWTAKDARIYAEGQLAVQRANQQRANQPNGSGNEAITQANGIAPLSTSQTRLPPPKSDAEIAKMSLTQQEAYWAGRVGDSELQY